MEIKTNTKFNLGDRVHGTVTMKNNDGMFTPLRFEGKVTDIILEYGKYCDNDIHDKVILKEQYHVSYKVVTDDDIVINCTENNLAIVKRCLDYFTTEELEKEIIRRKTE